MGTRSCEVQGILQDLRTVRLVRPSRRARFAALLMHNVRPTFCMMMYDPQVSITFAPIVVLWLVCNAAIGIYQLAQHGGSVFKGVKVVA